LPVSNYAAAIELNKDNIANYFTINLYNSKSADNNIIRFAAFDKANVIDGNTTYTQGANTLSFTLYRSVEIQVIDNNIVKNYVKWIRHDSNNINVTTDGAIVTVKDLPAAYYKVVPATTIDATSTVVNVSFWDETKATTTALTKYNYGSPDCEINNKYYAAPTSENLVLPTA
jgi:hypothetical protein